jgi:elongation factor Tu
VETGAELAPGARAEVDLELDRAIALEPGVRFALREGGKTIGAGVVTTIT